MARAHRKSDNAYNARRRFRRQAERYERKANETSGAAAARYRGLAAQAAENALATYENKSARDKGRISELASRVGASVPERTPDLNKLESKSLELVGNAEDLREAEAKAILSRGNIGSRFYGGLVEVWQGKSNINQAIKEHFGVDNLMDVLEILEGVANIYTEPDETTNPSDGLSTLEIQRYVLQREQAI